MSVRFDEMAVESEREAPSATLAGGDAADGASRRGAAKRQPRGADSGVGLLTELLGEAQARGASDVLLIAGTPPTVFVEGRWKALQETAMGEAQVAACLEPLLSEEQRDKLRLVRDLDMGFAVSGGGRFRVNVHYQRGSIAAAFWAIS